VSETVRIRAGRLLDVVTGEELRDRLVTVRDDRIESVAAFEGGAVDLDLSNHTVMPGLIDCHAHLIGQIESGHGYGLSSAIYTTDPLHAFRFRERVSAGMVSVNNSTSGAEAHLPFGGNGRSGNGARQSGVWVLDQFTRWQSMNWDYSGGLQKAQMDVADLAGDPSFRLSES